MNRLTVREILEIFKPFGIVTIGDEDIAVLDAQLAKLCEGDIREKIAKILYEHGVFLVEFKADKQKVEHDIQRLAGELQALLTAKVEEARKQVYYDIHTDLMSITCRDSYESMSKRVDQLLKKVQEKMLWPPHKGGGEIE